MNTAKRELSSQAQVAKLCRQYCKSIGVKARATSNSFSMGDSVTVYITDQPPAVRDQIETELKQYQYGSFNGMEDIYENTNRRNDIPQTKYLDVSCEYTDDLKQAAWDFIREHFQGADEHPETWVDVPSSARVFEAWASDTLYRVLHGSLDCEFWAEYLAKQVKPATVSHVGNQSAHIEQHEHTKRGFMMYMVVLDTKVERDGFNDLRDSCKELGAGILASGAKHLVALLLRTWVALRTFLSPSRASQYHQRAAISHERTLIKPKNSALWLISSIVR